MKNTKNPNPKEKSYTTPLSSEPSYTKNDLLQANSQSPGSEEPLHNDSLLIIFILDFMYFSYRGLSLVEKEGCSFFDLSGKGER